MKVVQLGPYPPPHGGIQTHVTSLRDFLRRQRISCAVINITATRRQNSDHVYYPMHALQLAALLLRLRYDIVHIHIGGRLTRRLVGLGLFCSLVPGKKAVLTFHSGGYPSSAEAATARPATVRGFMLRRFDRVIGVNARIVDLFHRFGVSPARTRLISPYGVANLGSGNGEATLEDGDSQVISEFYRLHNPVLLTVGLLEPEYDLPLQIDVLGSLLPNFPRLGLAIIGSGSLEPRIRALVASKPYADHILVAGDVSHRATLCAMSRSALLIRSTIYDGDSIAIHEALDIGTPVIATDNGMRPAGVHLFRSGDPDALRRGIEERLSAGRRSAAAAIHTQDDNLKSILEVYQELSGERSA
jgi:glycosyltransferase involved in cell wall biosynthesis